MKTCLTILSLFLLTSSVTAQDEGFMYGKITTIDNKTFEGPIRWGKEEVLWVDLFNAAKLVNKNLDYLSRSDIRYLENLRNERNYNWTERWIGRWVSNDNHEQDFTHQFVCQFGEIKSIKPSWRDRADLVMQNGDKIEVGGEGYNDIGGEILILDTELGEVSMDWGRIELIEFKKTPSRLDNKFAEVLYGTVESANGTFTGFIAWDNDERLLSDKLDGRSEDGKVSIEFSKIKSIKQSWDEAHVELASGRKLEVCCTNDVNNENRGIVVDDEKVGKVLIPWKAFDRVTFSRPASMKGYDAFAAQKELSGSVLTRDGRTLSGKIIYDLDESHGYEMLQGKVNRTEYFIPFHQISMIAPSGRYGADLKLRNGNKISLEEGQDVSDLHQGVLVFSGKTEPVYVRWEEVKEIKFN